MYIIYYSSNLPPSPNPRQFIVIVHCACVTNSHLFPSTKELIVRRGLLIVNINSQLSCRTTTFIQIYVGLCRGEIPLVLSRLLLLVG